MGVSPTHKGKKCMNMTCIIFILKDVIFNEEEFPFKTDFKMDNQASDSQISQALISLIPKNQHANRNVSKVNFSKLL